jgi:hypothetical protein
MDRRNCQQRSSDYGVTPDRAHASLFLLWAIKHEIDTSFSIVSQQPVTPTLNNFRGSNLWSLECRLPIIRPTTIPYAQEYPNRLLT